jgi:hypothetical protein
MSGSLMACEDVGLMVYGMRGPLMAGEDMVMIMVYGRGRQLAVHGPVMARGPPVADLWFMV